MKLLVRSVYLLSLSLGLVVSAHAYEDLTQEWRTSVDYRDGKPNISLVRQGENMRGNRSRVEIGKNSDKYSIRYNNGFDIRLQSRGSSLKDLKFDISVNE